MSLHVILFEAPGRAQKGTIEMTEEIQCALETCRRPFTPKRPWQRFCTTQHRDMHWGAVRQILRGALTVLTDDGERLITVEELIKLKAEIRKNG